MHRPCLTRPGQPPMVKPGAGAHKKHRRHGELQHLHVNQPTLLPRLCQRQPPASFGSWSAFFRRRHQIAIPAAAFRHQARSGRNFHFKPVQLRLQIFCPVFQLPRLLPRRWSRLRKKIFLGLDPGTAPWGHFFVRRHDLIVPQRRYFISTNTSIPPTNIPATINGNVNARPMVTHWENPCGNPSP